MDDQNLLREVMECSKEDPWYRECLEHVPKYEDDFLSIRSKLTDEEQKLLDLCIGACEAFCDSHILVAYQLGMEHRIQIL